MDFFYSVLEKLVCKLQIDHAEATFLGVSNSNLKLVSLESKRLHLKPIGSHFETPKTCCSVRLLNKWKTSKLNVFFLQNFNCFFNGVSFPHFLRDKTLVLLVPFFLYKRKRHLIFINDGQHCLLLYTKTLSPRQFRILLVPKLLKELLAK